MVPEDKDSAYALLWPLVDPIKKRAALPSPCALTQEGQEILSFPPFLIDKL
jgi:hypothetical protein